MADRFQMGRIDTTNKQEMYCDLTKDFKIETFKTGWLDEKFHTKKSILQLYRIGDLSKKLDGPFNKKLSELIEARNKELNKKIWEMKTKEELANLLISRNIVLYVSRQEATAVKSVESADVGNRILKNQYHPVKFMDIDVKEKMESFKGKSDKEIEDAVTIVRDKNLLDEKDENISKDISNSGNFNDLCSKVQALGNVNVYGTNPPSVTILDMADQVRNIRTFLRDIRNPTGINLSSITEMYGIRSTVERLFKKRDYEFLEGLIICKNSQEVITLLTGFCLPSPTVGDDFLFFGLKENGKLSELIGNINVLERYVKERGNQKSNLANKYISNVPELNTKIKELFDMILVNVIPRAEKEVLKIVTEAKNFKAKTSRGENKYKYRTLVYVKDRITGVEEHSYGFGNTADESIQDAKDRIELNRVEVGPDSDYI